LHNTSYPTKIINYSTKSLLQLQKQFKVRTLNAFIVYTEIVFIRYIVISEIKWWSNEFGWVLRFDN